MFKDHNGLIQSFDWGKFVINGVIHSMDGEGVGKDVCIIHGKVYPWKARKGHQLQPEMVVCVFNQGVEVLVIGNGVNGALKVKKKTQKAIKAAGIETLVVERTPEACKIFNRLYSEGKNVALLAHGTC
jgi:hypothetical protein